MPRTLCTAQDLQSKVLIPKRRYPDGKIILPPAVKGQVRDFFVRIVITADEVPEITFAPPQGEIISFEDMDEDVFKCEIGVNVFAFTETDSGIFIVNRKQVDIDVSIEFDPCGGILDKTVYEFKLGAQATVTLM